MPFVAGVYSLPQLFGTGTDPGNTFPPQVGAVADDIAAALNAIGSNILNVLHFGAKGDGTTDDTVAIQAAIAAAIATKAPLFAPSGDYKITSALNFGVPGTDRTQGFEFFGNGSSGTSGSFGTRFIFYGASTQSVINCSIFRSGYFHDFAILCNTPLAATYGLLVPDSTVSGLRFVNIQCFDVSRAFGELVGSGANGEFFTFDRCGGERVDMLWYSNAGQGFTQKFIDCGADLNHNGTYFFLDFASGGGGIDVFNFNSTGLHPAGTQVTNTTLVRAQNNSSSINFFGGRVEWLTRLLFVPAGSFRLTQAPKFIGMDITIDNDVGNVNNTINNFIQDINHFDVISIESCSLSTVVFTGNQANNIRVNVATAFPQPYVEFKNCLISLNKSPVAGLPPNVKLTDCLFQPLWEDDTGYLINQGAFGFVFSTEQFNPFDKSVNIVLTNFQQTATSTAAVAPNIARGIVSRSSGKVHIEFRTPTDNNTGFGFCSFALDIVNNYLGGDGAGRSVGFYPGTNSQFFFQNSSTGLGTGVRADAGDVYAMEVNFDIGKVWVRNVTKAATGWNNDILANQNPATNTGGFVFSLANGPFSVGVDIEDNGDVITMNSGDSVFVLSPSSGYNNIW